jgi:hypothetical protein
MGNAKKETKKERRSTHISQWAAQFAVASELVKRGYEVAFTMGNHPKKDLLVVSPSGAPFAIDVKGLHDKTNFSVSSRPSITDLFYVLVHVPTGAANSFFVLTHAEVNECIESATEAWRAKNDVPTTTVDTWPIIKWADAQRFKDAWDKFPK